MLFWSKLIGGIVLVLVGVFWMLQGLNVIQGYLMSGQTTFFVVGVVVAQRQALRLAAEGGRRFGISGALTLGGRGGLSFRPRVRQARRQRRRRLRALRAR